MIIGIISMMDSSCFYSKKQDWSASLIEDGKSLMTNCRTITNNIRLGEATINLDQRAFKQSPHLCAATATAVAAATQIIIIALPTISNSSVVESDGELTLFVSHADWYHGLINKTLSTQIANFPSSLLSSRQVTITMGRITCTKRLRNEIWDKRWRLSDRPVAKENW